MPTTVTIKTLAFGHRYEIEIIGPTPKGSEIKAFEYSLEEFLRFMLIPSTRVDDEVGEYIECPRLHHIFQMQPSCGAYVCQDCGHHRGLARCHCGWAADGGDGVSQLRAMGETIEEDE